jgi:hypothetical protein
LSHPNSDQRVAQRRKISDGKGEYLTITAAIDAKTEELEVAKGYDVHAVPRSQLIRLKRCC